MKQAKSAFSVEELTLRSEWVTQFLREDLVGAAQATTGKIRA